MTLTGRKLIAALLDTRSEVKVQGRNNQVLGYASAEAAIKLCANGRFAGFTRGSRVRTIRDISAVDLPPTYTGWHISEGPVIQPSIDYMRAMYGLPQI